MKQAFTIIELVFSIAIISIVTITGARYVGFVYEDLIDKSALSEAENTARESIKIVSYLLENSIKESVVIVQDSAYGACQSVHSQNSVANPTVVWYGVEKNGFLGEWDGGYYQPYWSGVADLGKSNSDSLTDPIGDFDKQKTLMQNLYGNGYSMAVYFADTSAESCGDFYVNGGSKSFEVSGSAKTLTFSNKKPQKITQKYALSNGAYALLIENGSELVMYYDFYPWKNESYTDGKRSLLGKNIDSMAIKSDSGLIRISICAKVKNQSATICHEEALF